jgi:hypothetical protein
MGIEIILGEGGEKKEAHKGLLICNALSGLSA